MEIDKSGVEYWVAGRKAWSQAGLLQDELEELEVDRFFKIFHMKLQEKKAAQCFAEAAARDHVDGLVDLSVCFKYGSGVRKNLSLSFEHRFRAAKMQEDMREFESSEVKSVNF